MSLYISCQRKYYYLKNDRLAYTDSMTGLLNRRFYNIKKAELSNLGKIKNLTVVAIDLNMLKYTNDNFGHEIGDQLIKGCADILSSAFFDAEVVSRMGGDEFSILTKVDQTALNKNILELERLSKDYEITHSIKMHMAIGHASTWDFPNASIEELENEADRLMYENKKFFYQNSEFERRKSEK